LKVEVVDANYESNRQSLLTVIFIIESGNSVMAFRYFKIYLSPDSISMIIRIGDLTLSSTIRANYFNFNIFFLYSTTIIYCFFLNVSMNEVVSM
ncbi:hypothetical protein B4U22_37300, partial [Klebsiella pneumoniae]